MLHKSKTRQPFSVALVCILAGAAMLSSLPPFGWWPLGILGFALLDDLIANTRARQRFLRTWLVALTWLSMGMIWMWDMTAPGYMIAAVLYSAYFGVAAIFVPGGAVRRVALPGAVVLAEALRWSWPFGGVPLATVAHGQVGGPLASVVRLGGPLVLVAITVICGQAVASLARRERLAAFIGFSIVLFTLGIAQLVPGTKTIGALEVAIVQGGGPQRTRAQASDAEVVFNRHLEAAAAIVDPVDLIVLPENVVHVDDNFPETHEATALGELARKHNAPVIVGVVESTSGPTWKNAVFVIDAAGEVTDRYDKVRRVPFGEFVPLRTIIEMFSGAVPAKDAAIGQTPALVTAAGVPLASPISWEVFFAGRAREGVQLGAEAIVNPTNGSSYWLSFVQSQQIASSRLRALENDRWVIQAAPTGFSALIAPDGHVVERSAISEQKVIQGSIERRVGQTWASRMGDLPAIAVAMAAILVANLLKNMDQSGVRNLLMARPKTAA